MSTEARTRSIRLSLVAPVTLLTALLVGMTIFFVGYGSVRQNRQAEADLFATAQAAFQQQKDFLGRTALDYALWDDAVNFVVLKRDLAWLDTNIGDGVFVGSDADTSFVIDANDSMWYLNSEQMDQAKISPLMPDLLTLARQARAAPLDNPIPTTGVLSIDGQLYNIGVGAITPQGMPTSPSLPDEPRSVFGFMYHVTPEQLLEIGSVAGIPDFQYAPQEPFAKSKLALSAPSGQPAGFLTWKAVAPGTQFIKLLIMPGLVVAAIVAFVIAVIFKRSFALAKDLVDREEDLEAQVTNLEVSRMKAQAADRAKSEFLATMSHELRTPLNAIIGFSQIISEQGLGPDQHDKYVEYARDIHDSGQHLLTIINNVLDLSKIEAGKFDLYFEDIHVEELIKSSARFVENKTNGENKSIVIEIAEQGLRVNVDSGAIRQVFINLLSNAAKFSPENTVIRVKSFVCSDRNGIVFEVADEGIGISEDQIDHVLAPFNQADATHTRSHQGTGLGLPIAKRLSELHGGTLEISSALDQGTTVRIILPLDRLVSTDQAA